MSVLDSCQRGKKKASMGPTRKPSFKIFVYCGLCVCVCVCVCVCACARARPHAHVQMSLSL